MEPYVQECTQVFLDKLGSFARSGESINMQHWLQCYAFDVIGLITVRVMSSTPTWTLSNTLSHSWANVSAFSTAAKTWEASSALYTRT